MQSLQTLQYINAFQRPFIFSTQWLCQHCNFVDAICVERLCYIRFTSEGHARVIVSCCTDQCNLTSCGQVLHQHRYSTVLYKTRGASCKTPVRLLHKQVIAWLLQTAHPVRNEPRNRFLMSGSPFKLALPNTKCHCNTGVMELADNGPLYAHLKPASSS